MNTITVKHQGKEYAIPTMYADRCNDLRDALYDAMLDGKAVRVGGDEPPTPTQPSELQLLHMDTTERKELMRQCTVKYLEGLAFDLDMKDRLTYEDRQLMTDIKDIIEEKGEA